MKHNLAQLPQEEMDKVNVDLAAAGVAFKERYNMPVI
ncbi:MAG TPA: DNA polymerase III subunit theta, partial [Franconibacter pulveris]|nr:DNA polymerase III subunit theta [Franconibacter pulveris]